MGFQHPLAHLCLFWLVYQATSLLQHLAKIHIYVEDMKALLLGNPQQPNNIKIRVGNFIGFLCITCTECLYKGYLPPKHKLEAPYNYIILENDLIFCILPLLILPMSLQFFVVYIINQKKIQFKNVAIQKWLKKTRQPKGMRHTTIAKTKCKNLSYMLKTLLTKTNCNSCKICVLLTTSQKNKCGNLIHIISIP